MNARMNEQMDAWVNHGWMNGWMDDRWMDEQIDDGWMGGSLLSETVRDYDQSLKL